MKLSKNKWLNQKIQFIPNKWPWKVKMEKREIVFAKQGLTALEIDINYDCYLSRANGER